MDQASYILVIDQGTTVTKAILLEGSGGVVWQTSQEMTQAYPQPYLDPRTVQPYTRADNILQVTNVEI